MVYQCLNTSIDIVDFRLFVFLVSVLVVLPGNVFVINSLNCEHIFHDTKNNYIRPINILKLIPHIVIAHFRRSLGAFCPYNMVINFIQSKWSQLNHVKFRLLINMIRIF